MSIVVYARDDAEFLAALLPQLLQQDYPREYEVVVVNEGQSDSTSDTVTALQTVYPNLYLTFTPEGARNLSRKKLALTLGIKAARYPVVAIVDADTSVPSPLWLRRMASHFADCSCEVVIGTSMWDRDNDDMRGARRRTFDCAADAVTYLAPAAGGHPYRGTSHNLMYRRDLFFANKGFSRSLNLRYGDDDIFVSEISRGDNTCVEITPESVTRIRSFNPARAYRELRKSRAFTSRFVSKSSRRLMGFCSLLLYVWLAASVVAVVAGLPSLLPAVAVLVLALILWIPLVLVWRHALMSLGAGRLGWSLPWLIMTRPFHTIATRIRAMRTRTRQYTWG